MKRVMSLILGLALLIAFSAMPAAEPETAKSTKSSSSERMMDQASPKLMTGKITQIDKNGRTFVVVSNGKQYRFSYGKVEWSYRVGQIVDVSYVVNPAGQMEATNLNSSKSNVY